MTEIDPKLSFLRPGKGAAAQPTAPPAEPVGPDASGPPPSSSSAVDPRLDLAGAAPPARSLRPSIPLTTLLRAGVMAAALAVGAVQVGSGVVNAPPPARGEAALTANRTAPSQVVRISAEARQGVSGGPVSWRAFFDHYDLPDSVRDASMRRALGNLSPADLDAAADAPIPQDRDIEIVLVN